MKNAYKCAPDYCFFATRFLGTVRPISCNFRPSVSSFAKSNRSSSKLRQNNTLAYAPNVTPLSPFSILRSVVRVIPAHRHFCRHIGETATIEKKNLRRLTTKPLKTVLHKPKRERFRYLKLRNSSMTSPVSHKNMKL